MQAWNGQTLWPPEVEAGQPRRLSLQVSLPGQSYGELP